MVKKMEYLIYAPPYRGSAGIRVMHLLAHHLNESGYNAFVPTSVVNPDLNVIAVKSAEHLRKLRADWIKNEPIVVYPEIIKDNPMGYKKVVRYILNNPTWGGQEDIKYGANDIIIAYNKYCQSFCPPNSPILEISSYDLSAFNNNNPVQRQGGVFWVYKGYNVPRVPDTDTMKELIMGTLDNIYDRADLLRQSEIFYSYDNNSALNTEARLCGCPTVIIPDPALKLTKDNPLFMSQNGLAWGNSKEEIQFAKDTVHLFADDFADHFKDFEKQLQNFITITQGV